MSGGARPDAVAFQPDGKVIVAGAFDYASGTRVGDHYSLARLTSQGRTDPSFAATLATNDKVKVMQVQPDGGVIAAGTFSGGGATHSFARFNANGSRDLSFALPDIGSSGFKIDATGRIYVVRSAGTAFQLERFLADGRTDSSFAAISLALPTFAIWPDGSGVVPTLVPKEAPRTAYTLARFSAQGAIDPSHFIDYSDLPLDLLDLVAIPGGAVVALGRTDPHSSALSYVRFSPAGAADYVFRTDASLGASLPDVAGVLLDALQDAAPPSTTHVRADLGTGYTVEVDATGRANILNGDYLGGISPREVTLHRFQRSGASGPSVPAAPVASGVFAADDRDPADAPVNLGGTARLGIYATGLLPLTYQWKKAGVPIAGAISATLTLLNFSASDAASYSVEVSNPWGAVSSTAMSVTANLQSVAPAIPESYGRATRIAEAGETVSFMVQVLGNPVPTPTWSLNGRPLSAGTSIKTSRTEAWATLDINNAQPADAGIYTLSLMNSLGTFVGQPIVVGIASTIKTLGMATEVGANLHHPNGNIYDQVLLTGGAASITADPGQVTRTSFLDFNGDIVQVEFAGAGTLTLVLDSPTAPAPPANYQQPNVSYVTGQARIIVVDADETTNLSVFSVGRANAIDQSLFREGVDYDGMADIACVSISSRNGRFGGLRCGNTSFVATAGFAGVYAPNVRFVGPINIGDVSAFGDGQAMLLVGAGSTVPSITGGNLLQANGRSVRVEGLSHISFVDGTDSQGRPQPAQQNQAKFEQSGIDITNSLVGKP